MTTHRYIPATVPGPLGRYRFLPGPVPGPLGASDDQDLIRLNAELKKGLFEKNGYYKTSDGSPRKSAITGRAVPRISFGQAKALFSFWFRTYEGLFAKLNEAGRPSSSLGMAAWRATRSWQSWTATYSSQSQYQFVSFGAADSFFDLVGRFVNEIDAGVWSGYNTETAWENAMESISWSWGTAGQRIRSWGKRAADAMEDIADAMGISWELFKWGSVAFVGYYAYTKFSKEKS